MTTGRLKEYTFKCLEREAKSLSSAEILLKEGNSEDCVSRAYYAMFHAARAILHEKGIRVRTHKSTIDMFGLHLVKAGMVDKRLGRMLSDAFKLRQASDYEVNVELESEEIKELVDGAREFIEKIKEMLKAT